MNDYRAIMIVIITILISALSRLLPMLLFSKAEKTPEIITYLSKVLPSAIMAFLVIYCLKDTDLFAGNHGIPEALASALVVLTYVYKRNSLLSILSGTLCYMFLVQVIFI